MFDSHWLSTFANVPSWSPCTLGCCSEELAGIQRTDSAVSLPLENICCACLYVCECMSVCIPRHVCGSPGQLYKVSSLLPSAQWFWGSIAGHQTCVANSFTHYTICCATITYFWYILVCIYMRPRLYALCPHPYLCVNTLLHHILTCVITCVSCTQICAQMLLWMSL